MRACTSPRLTSSVTSSVATMPPNRFETFFSSSMLLPREHARDALRREQHDREQHDAYSQARVLLIVREHRGEPLHPVVGDQVFQTEQPRRTDHPAPELPDPAEDHHHHERPRVRPVQHVRVDVLAMARQERSGEAGPGTGDDEARELVAVYREAERPGALPVVADRPGHPTGRRMRAAMPTKKARCPPGRAGG